jgi:hypothetical protein
MLKSVSVILALVVHLSIQSAEGAGITGRFTTAAYTFERSNPDTVSQGSFRLYQSARFRVMSLVRPELSFQTYIRSSLDFANKAANDPKHRLYHGYLRWQDIADRFELTAGRQLVLSGVGVGRIDGIRAKARLHHTVRLDIFAGTLVGARGEGVGNWSEGHMFGGRLSTTSVLSTRLGASFYRRSRRVEPFLSPARVAAGLSSLEIQPGEVEQQMVGFHLQRALGKRMSLYGRWDLSTPGGVRTRRAEGVLRYHHKGFTLSGEWLLREPYVDKNSIFSMFAQSSNQEISFRSNYRINRFLGLFGELSRVTYDSDDGYRLNLGLNLLNGYIGYTRRRGFGGVSDGFTSTLRYRIHKELWTSGGFNFTRFLLYDGEGQRSQVMSATLGMDYRPSRYLTLSLQGQSLAQNLKLATGANPFTGLSRDFRFFFKASTWFFRSNRKERAR